MLAPQNEFTFKKIVFNDTNALDETYSQNGTRDAVVSKQTLVRLTAVGIGTVLAVVLPIVIRFAFTGSGDYPTTLNAPSGGPARLIAPAPPGLEYAPAVTFSTTIAGSVADFNRTAYRNNLAGLIDGVDSNDVTLAVYAGSVVIDATIMVKRVPLDIVVSILGSYEPTNLSIYLGVIVEKVQTPLKTTVLITASPRTPPLLPSTPPPSQPSNPPLAPSCKICVPLLPPPSPQFPYRLPPPLPPLTPPSHPPSTPPFPPPQSPPPLLPPSTPG